MSILEMSKRNKLNKVTLKLSTFKICFCGSHNFIALDNSFSLIPDMTSYSSKRVCPSNEYTRRTQLLNKVTLSWYTLSICFVVLIITFYLILALY